MKERNEKKGEGGEMKWKNDTGETEGRSEWGRKKGRRGGKWGVEGMKIRGRDEG